MNETAKRKQDKNDDNLPTLMKQKRKKNEMASSQDDTVYDGRSIDNLPHEILLIIFSKLNINHVCQLARVCKSFKKAAYDDLLWYQIDLTDLTLNLKRLWKFFRHKKFSNAKSIKFRGNLSLNTNNYQRSRQTCTKSLMLKLKSSCSQLEKLELTYCDLSDVAAEDFAEHLEELNLIRCEIPLKWFEKNKFKRLIRLNLSGSSRVCSSHLKDLTSLTRLNELNLNNCYRINDKAVEVLVMLALSKLILSGTDITQYGIQLICSKLSHSLVYLNLKACKNLTDNEINFIKETFIQNEKFHLEY